MDQIKTLLLVDDDTRLRDSVMRGLHGSKLRFLQAANGKEALELTERESIDLVLLDLGMPIMDGHEFLRRFRVQEGNGHIPVCIMTGSSDDEVRSKAIDAGADDFIEKPANVVELRTRVKSLLRISGVQRELYGLNANLEKIVGERTAALTSTLDRLSLAKRENDMAYRETIVRLCIAAEMKDKCTAAHLERIGHYSSLLAAKLGWTAPRRMLMLDAAKMHDIGKLGIPDSILDKPGRLTAEEFKAIEKHTEIGNRILAGSKSTLLQLAASIALIHHEKFNGEGYPAGLSGKEIPVEGRIVAIADVFDALMTERAYKEPYPLEMTVAIMRKSSGTHLDPDLLALFLESLDDFHDIHNRFASCEVALS